MLEDRLAVNWPPCMITLSVVAAALSACQLQCHSYRQSPQCPIVKQIGVFL